MDAFEACEVGVYLRVRTFRIFDLTRLMAKPKSFQSVIQGLFYADDAKFGAHTEKDTQTIMDHVLLL